MEVNKVILPELQQFQIGLSLGNTIVHTYFQSRKLKENSLF